MLINKDTSEVVFINKDTGEKVSCFCRRRSDIKCSDDCSCTTEPCAEELMYTDVSATIKAHLICIALIFVFLFTIASAIFGIAKSEAQYIDKVNENCIKSDTACVPINVNGTY